MLQESSSPCVCGRHFYWRRILNPEVPKGDTPNWLVSFGSGVTDKHWVSWCNLLKAEPMVVSIDWGVLLVTSESPELQLQSDAYTGFDCKFVRVLSDESCRIGAYFGVTTVQTENGQTYPFAVVRIQSGVVQGRFG